VSVQAEATTFSGAVHAASFVDEGETPS
jgi:hypothetical protein